MFSKSMGEMHILNPYNDSIFLKKKADSSFVSPVVGGKGKPPRHRDGSEMGRFPREGSSRNLPCKLGWVHVIFWGLEGYYPEV